MQLIYLLNTSHIVTTSQFFVNFATLNMKSNKKFFMFQFSK